MGSEGFIEGVTSGDRRRSLEAMRDKLAADMESVEPRYVAALAHQLMDVLKALHSMPAEKGSAVDELARRRADRRGRAKVADVAEGGDVGRSGGGRSR